MYVEGLCLALRLLFLVRDINVAKAREELTTKSSERGISRIQGEEVTKSLIKKV